VKVKILRDSQKILFYEANVTMNTRNKC